MELARATKDNSFKLSGSCDRSSVAQPTRPPTRSTFEYREGVANEKKNNVSWFLVMEAHYMSTWAYIHGIQYYSYVVLNTVVRYTVLWYHCTYRLHRTTGYRATGLTEARHLIVVVVWMDDWRNFRVQYVAFWLQEYRVKLQEQHTNTISK